MNLSLCFFCLRTILRILYLLVVSAFVCCPVGRQYFQNVMELQTKALFLPHLPLPVCSFQFIFWFGSFQEFIVYFIKFLLFCSPFIVAFLKTLLYKMIPFVVKHQTRCHFMLRKERAAREEQECYPSKMEWRADRVEDCWRWLNRVEGW